MNDKKKIEKSGETPLMKQYNAIKSKYPDAVLLFRVGDFYETFGDDAVKASKILGIILTKRNNGAGTNTELAGFPHHSLDNYLPKLVRAGLRVAICDQLEDPKMVKGIVKRGVTELVTPGVSFNEKVLENKSNNFLACVHFGVKSNGVSFLDISTGEFLVSQGDANYIDKLLQSFKPSEVLFQKSNQKKFTELFGDRFYTFKLDEWIFANDFSNEILNRHFGTKSLKGFGVENLPEGIIAAGAILHYLGETAHDKLGHLTTLSRIEEDHYVWLDRFTIRNLELVYSINENAKTLIDILDYTKTPMGSRMMKRWMLLPLKNKDKIQERLDAVKTFINDEKSSSELSKHLNEIGDLERLISKVAVGRISPREIIQLLRSLQSLIPIKEYSIYSTTDALKKIGEQMNTCDSIRQKIEQEIVADAPVAIGKSEVIRPGVDAELDELRELQKSGKDYLIQLQQREAAATGISSLKVAYNNVFGYYLEVTHLHKDKVPAEWIRKQTLTNAERYITEELKTYETKILGAEEKILQIENRIFSALVNTVSDYIPAIQLNANLLAQIDCLLSFSEASIKNNYTQPLILTDTRLTIKNGRHPVIEHALPEGESYVPNDIYLDTEQQQIIMITGPNMAGKSALLRQTALIVLMAQMGCYVPAQAAEIGLVDKIFTRVGASDNISSGESTFMVEMNETASILNNISERSLILLDEIGRGTSTYDGISIAWSIAEFLHQNEKAHPKTLFATHYHELNDMEKQFSRIKNFTVSVKEIDQKIIFMRKLIPGGSEHSFGIHVAKLAGMPSKVVIRANEILKELEKRVKTGNKNQAPPTTDDKMQLSFFQLDDPVLIQIKEQLEGIDINTLTPVEALMKLNEIKKLMGK